jgi:hypothetical protein
LTVLVVWEPILGSDWSRPTRPVLARISDVRVLQYWDMGHLIAKQMDRQLTTRQPHCCRHDGTLWDLAALYSRGVLWGSTEPVYIDGPVAKVKAELARETSSLSHGTGETLTESLPAMRNRGMPYMVKTETR